ncbi:MAG: hypothetical protein HW406_1631 [Candidatus Brocadiaceae bacterium]|nr:hypothetical protein [Candidatus Brocadiaceae bacterium]
MSGEEIGEKISDILLEHFSIIILSGLVFTIFSILLPTYLWSHLSVNPHLPLILSLLLGITKKLYRPFLFIITAFGVGFLLDILNPLRLWNKLFFLNKNRIDFKVSIVESFNIHTNKDLNRDKKYIERVTDISMQIHKAFIKAYHPEVDRRIEINRIYHETVIMSFFSILFGLLFSIVIIGYTTWVNMKQELRPHQVPSQIHVNSLMLPAFPSGLENPAPVPTDKPKQDKIDIYKYVVILFQYPYYLFGVLVALVVLFLVIYYWGYNKVTHELSETNTFTVALLRKTFIDNTNACRKFLKDTLGKGGEKSLGIIANGKWKVREP